MRRRRQGIPVFWVLVAAAVVGIGSGVGLSLRQQWQESSEDPIGASEAVATAATPLGDPLEAPGGGGGSRWVEAFAVDPESVRGLPAYPNAEPRGIRAPPRVQGVPMALSWFETSDPVHAVLTYYDAYLTLMKQHHVTHQFHEGAGYSGWLEPTRDWGLPDGGYLPPDAGSLVDGIMHLATALRQGDKTVVLLSAMDPMAVLNSSAPELPSGLVLPPAAGRPQVFELGEVNGARLAAHARVRNGRLPDVVAFYERHFTEGKWSLTAKQVDGEKSVILTAARGGEVLVVSLQAEPYGVSVLLDSAHTAPP